MGEFFPGELSKFLIGGLLSGLQHDEGAGRFAPPLVGKADHGHLLDRRMAEQAPFDFDG